FGCGRLFGGESGIGVFEIEGLLVLGTDLDRRRIRGEVERVGGRGSIIEGYAPGQGRNRRFLGGSRPGVISKWDTADLVHSARGEVPGHIFGGDEKGTGNAGTRGAAVAVVAAASGQQAGQYQ